MSKKGNRSMTRLERLLALAIARHDRATEIIVRARIAAAVRRAWSTSRTSCEL